MTSPAELEALAQPRILHAPTSPALFLTVGLRGETGRRSPLLRLAGAADPSRTVLGVGAPVATLLGAEVPGLRPFTAVSGRGVSYPSTQGALFLGLYDGDPGELLQEGLRLMGTLGAGFALDDEVHCFQYREGRDLSGYVDGTANPVGDEATRAALVDGPSGLAGSSFVSVQRWIHDAHALERMRPAEKDQMMGRRLSDNEEMDDAPESAHVKRTAQEVGGFLLRRSMPWGTVDHHGLQFVAYGRDPDTFLTHLKRMSGSADGVVDGINRISRPVTGGLYWCPPVRADRFDLRLIGLG